MRYFAFTILAFSALLLRPSTALTQSYESYFLYLGDHPQEEELDWAEECQGLAHDDQNWYITQNVMIWKVPVTLDVNQDFGDNPSPAILKKHINDTPLGALNYNHFGDPDCVYYNGEYLLFVPVETGKYRAIAVFKAKDLSYVNHDYLPKEEGAAWCAIDNNGVLYGSNDVVRSLYMYSIDWNSLYQKGSSFLKYKGEFYLKDETGASLELKWMQGGDFTDDGSLLYLINGNADDTECDCGIHVFDMQSGKLIARSTNGSGYFNFEFNANCYFGNYRCEEPEGVTVWDLDGAGAPNISGQLHVLLLDNDDPAPNDDDIYIKHYTHTINVDNSRTGNENGTPQGPFHTLAKAGQFAWNGARIKIRGGRYLESLLLDKQIQISSSFGDAIVGRQGQFKLTPQGRINIIGTGKIKIY